MTFGARFLANPDLFPARLAGEPWGEREVLLDLPGGPYRFSGLAAAQQERVRSRFPASPTPAAGSVTEVLMLRAPAADFKPIDLRGWAYDLDTDATAQTIRLAGLAFMARLDWRPCLTGALWTPDGGGEAFGGIFENFFRVLVAYRLLELGGVVLHSAGIVRSGEAFLFLGRSGAGKTTVAAASLARGAEVLSDDLNAVRLEGGLPVLERLPFTGDLGGPLGSPGRSIGPSLPLCALLRLEQDTQDALVPLSRAETLGCLLVCSPFVNADRYRRGQLADTLLRLLEGPLAPAGYALRFTLSDAFWTILNEKWIPLRRAPS